MAYFGLYWNWDCQDFQEVVLLERIFFDFGDAPMIAMIHCSDRPRRRNVEVQPGTRMWTSLLATLREIFSFAGNLHPDHRLQVGELIMFMANSRKARD